MDWSGHHQKNLQTINSRGIIEKKEPPTLLVGLQIGTDTMEDGMEIPLKSRNKNHHMTQKSHC